MIAFLILSCAPNDQKLARHVQAGVVVLDSNIRVDVKEGVVTLSGMVMDESTRNAAESAVKEIKGVRSVINNTTVREVVTGAVPGPDERLHQAIDSSLTSQNIKGVHVSVQEGEVTLTGTTKKAQLTRIMKAVNESRPKRVVNELKVE
jgi:hyperosmotically inducible protein